MTEQYFKPVRERRPSWLPGAAVCQSLQKLVELRHYALYSDPRCKLVVAYRTPVGFDLLGDIHDCFSQVGLALTGLPRNDYCLLVDVRNGPTRNDSTFEATLETHRGRLLRGFAKNAALAKTAAGRLQIKRFARSDNRKVFVTDSPDAAFKYLGLPPHTWPTPL